MLNISSLFVRRCAASTPALASHWRSIARVPTANFFGSVPSSVPSKTTSQPVNGVNMVYYSTVAAVQSAWRSLVPTVTRQVASKIAPRVPVKVRTQAPPMVSKYMNKRMYCAPPTKGWKDVPMRAPMGPFTFLWRAFRGLTPLATLLLNATSVWYLHSTMHKDNPTWVSYMAFIPLIDWIPMLDLAGLPRYLVLLPVGIVAASAALGVGSSPLLGLIFVLPLIGLEVYRNYYILHHFETRNWTTILLWSVFRLEWLAMSGLSILGFDRYQLVPHKQASFTETLQQVRARLDESLDKPELLTDFNPPFIVFNFLWKNGLKFVVDATANFIHNTGIPDATGNFTDKAGAFVDSLIPSTSSSDSEKHHSGDNKQKLE